MGQVDPWSATLSIGLALLVVAGLAAALTWTLMRNRQRDELRHCRQELRTGALLQRGWAWHTGPDHRLLSWQTQPGRTSVVCTPFDEPGPLHLMACLETRQAFQGLRVDTPSGSEGFRSWELHGVPLHDDTGAFAGFKGTARPTDEEQRHQDDAMAFAALLAALPTPTLTAFISGNGGNGLRVKHFNTAASLLWPGIEVGQLLSQLMVQIPEAAVQAGRVLLDSGPTQVQGWRLQALPAPIHSPSSGRGVLLMRLPQDDTKATSGLQAEGDSFSFTLSHDLRAPIRVVEGFTRIVKEDYGKLLDRVGNDHLDRVLGAATRMNLMIEALLTLARLSQQPLAHQRVNLSQMAGFVAEDLRRSAPDRDAQIDIGPNLTAWGDPTLLRLVLENLLSNAWKYCGRCAQTRISLGLVQQGDRHVFLVRDNGAGFDMRSADRLFGLFQRLHSASDFPGHGVGLASVRRIVQRHGGDIWAESEPGQGASFFFTLAA
jgi:signal transduction histidine kinase